MLILAGIFSLLVAAAGWYYMFYSRAAQKLATIEGTKANRRRVTLRRINGATMCALAVVMYVGVAALTRQDEHGPRPDIKLFAGMMFALVLLIIALLVLGLMDLRLTRDLRRRYQRDRDEPPMP